MSAKRKVSLLSRLDKESILSVGLGAIVVIIVGLLITNYFVKVKKVGGPGEEDLTIEEPRVTPEAPKGKEPGFESQPTELPTEHTVVKGEHLWGLAVRYYNDGYQWVAIARENKLTNPSLIYPGQKLNIPKVEPAKKAEELAKRIEELGGKIEGKEYTVVRGDDLCKIALRAYGDCTKGWEIAKINNLANPHLIHAGNVLRIPRD